MGLLGASGRGTRSNAAGIRVGFDAPPGPAPRKAPPVEPPPPVAAAYQPQVPQPSVAPAPSAQPSFAPEPAPMTAAAPMAAPSPMTPVAPASETPMPGLSALAQASGPGYQEGGASGLNTALGQRLTQRSLAALAQMAGRNY